MGDAVAVRWVLGVVRDAGATSARRKEWRAVGTFLKLTDRPFLQFLVNPSRVDRTIFAGQEKRGCSGLTFPFRAPARLPPAARRRPHPSPLAMGPKKHDQMTSLATSAAVAALLLTLVGTNNTSLATYFNASRRIVSRRLLASL